MRTLQVIKKDYKQIVRDRAFLVILIIEPLILMFVFGYTFQSNIKHLNTVIIDYDHSQYSAEIINSAKNSEYFNVFDKNLSFDEAKLELRNGNIRSLIVIPAGLGHRLDNAEQSNISIYIDSSDYTIYNIIKAASGELLKDSIKNIVGLIVGNLETERDINKEKVDEINSLMDSLKNKANNTKRDLDVLLTDFDSLESRFSEMEDISKSLKSSLTSLPPGVALPNETIQKIDDLQSEINSAKTEIRGKRSDVNSIRNNTENLKNDYNSISSKVESINFKLDALKKDFLSFPINIERNFEYGEISYFQYLAPAILSLVLFFVGITLTTTNIVEERNNITLFRMFMTPLNRWQIYFGKFFVFFIVGLIEAGYVMLISVYMFDVNIVGRISDVFLILSLLMASSLGLGLFVSTFLRTVRQTILVIPIIIIPVILISQTFSPVEVMPKFMIYISYFSPLFYSNTALRQIMIKGVPLSAIYNQVWILALFALITLILGVVVSRKRIT